MPYLFDTDVVIDSQKEETAIDASLARSNKDGHTVTAITCMEVVDGLLGRSNSDRAGTDFYRFLTSVTVLPFSLREAEQCAQLRTALRARNRAIRARYLDSMIAATAITHGLTLVTRYAADYRDIPGLDVVALEQLETSQP